MGGASTQRPCPEPDMRKPTLGEKVSSFGHTFTWTPLHKTPAELNAMIFTYDKTATEAVGRLDEIVPASNPPPQDSDKKDGDEKSGSATATKRDMFKLVKEHAKRDSTGVIADLWREVNEVPDWVDWEQIERGQKVFWRYIGPILTTLSQLSLLGSFAYGRAVKILSRTGSWKTENIMRRLLETTQHTLDVHRDLRSLQPGGDGWESSVRVRLLHAAVRARILSLANKTEPQSGDKEGQQKYYYDLENDGVPINDLDCIITMNDFSSLVTFCGLPRQGIVPTRQETADYIAVWRYICHVMGTPAWLLETPEQGRAMMESIFYAEVKPDPMSATISNNMVSALVGSAPQFQSRGYLLASAHWLNGCEVAGRALGLEKPGLWHNMLFAGSCWLFMVMSYSRRLAPRFVDDAINETAKKRVYDAVIHNKANGGLGYKAKFSFKWIPVLGFATPREGEPAERSRQSGLAAFGPEAVSLITLVLTAGLVLGSVAKGVSIATRLGLLPAQWVSG